MNKTKFDGPVFIIGMPRSGKKLLRDLLNKNPRIGIPIHETGFIPHLVERFGNPPIFDDDQEFNQFYREFSQDPYFQQFKMKGRILTKDILDKAIVKTSWNSIFESINRYYAPDGRDENFIWGDKSPHYLNFMPLLKDIFPEARFLHCIRDPRDFSLSYKKAWGKSIYRAAESWRERMEKGLRDSHQLETDYKEVFYESLLDDPVRELIDICNFLDCEFISSMTELNRAPESLGDTRGQLRIVRDNRNKYLTQLTYAEVRRIEEIVFPVARNLGYKLENDVVFKSVDPLMLKILTISDGWASIKFHINEYGLLKGLSRLFHWHSRSSWMASHFVFIGNVSRFVNRKSQN
jgi:hypothetical protein